MSEISRWTKASIELANEKDYLDQLGLIYALGVNESRVIDEELWKEISEAYKSKDDTILVEKFLKLKLFPIKYSYIPFLRKEKDALKRNPKTVKDIADRIRAMDIDELLKRCSEPKENNRQIGPLFRNWVNNHDFEIPLLGLKDFSRTDDDAILMGTDKELQVFAKEKLGYQRNKGLDFIARVNKIYVIGETKFLTDQGGHQNAQSEDSIATAKFSQDNVIAIAIWDGVCYIKPKKLKSGVDKDGTKLYRALFESEVTIMSALVLKDFLHSLKNESRVSK